MNNSLSKRPRNLVWFAVILLAILHHDFWFWNDRTLVCGFMPIGLFYHAMFSIAAAATWACAIKFAWPHHIEEWASEFDPQRDAAQHAQPAANGRTQP